MHSKTYCPYPFSHIAIDTDGAKTLCCVSARHNKTIPPMDSRVNQPINDYWNSKKLNKIRKELLLGERPNECKTCWDFEDKNITSERMQILHKVTNDLSQEEKQIIDDNIESVKNNDVMAHPPFSWDIKFGNLCNLTCIMCDSTKSSQINKEAKRHKHLPYYPHNEIDQSTMDWPIENTFWNDFNNVVSSIKYLKVTGGETLLNETYIEFLKKLPTNTSNSIITNGTKITEEMITNIFARFNPCVHINVSLDGINSNYEYIRYPARWKLVEENIKLLLKYNMDITVNPTFQLHNAFNYFEILKWAESLNIVCTQGAFVFGKSYLSVDCLTDSMKKELKEYYIKGKDKLNNINHKHMVKNVINYLSKETDPEIIKQNSRMLVRYTKTYNKIRNVSFEQSCPQEWNLVKEYFNDNSSTSN
jgi:MoaA/NifB/PqqE/SkfB family radical SAM enzyme